MNIFSFPLMFPFFFRLVVDVYVEIDAGGRRGMVTAIPFARMVMVLVIVVALVAACQGEYR